MEVDCFTALGAAYFLEERLKKSSDGYNLPVCARCGITAESNRDGYAFCRTCYTDRDVCTVNIPYANKLFLQELTALHIRPSLILAPVTADVSETDGGPEMPHANDDEGMEDYEVTAPGGPGGPSRALRARESDESALVPAAKRAKRMSYYELSQLPSLEPWEWESLQIAPPMNLRAKIEEMQSDSQEAARTGKTERTPPTAPVMWSPSSASPARPPSSTPQSANASLPLSRARLPSTPRPSTRARK